MLDSDRPCHRDRFGPAGIGGNPNTTAADGYYEVDIKPPSGQTAVHHFDRLLGDVTATEPSTKRRENEIATDIGHRLQLGCDPLSADATGYGTVTRST